MTAPGRAAAEAGPGAVPVSAYATELAFALEVAERAGELLMASYERVERITHKSPRDIVTEVDAASERLIIDAIRAAYPADAILAEETGAHDGTAPAESTREATDGPAPARVWVVDPLDGTINYANGIPFFCVSIGLAVGGRPSVGVVLDPSRHDRLAATVDGVATLNGRPVTCSTKERLTDYVVALGLGGRAAASRSRAVRRAVRVARAMGAAALEIAYVGAGRFDAFALSGGMSAWDVAAAGLIAERGGATVTNPIGGPWFDLAAKPGSVGLVAAPPDWQPGLLELAREPRSRESDATS